VSETQAADAATGRKQQMLHAAAELISARGFGDTRIADVARRSGVSPALVIYYFGSRDRLLIDALRYSDEIFYAAAEKLLVGLTSSRAKLEGLVRLTLGPDSVTEFPGSWGLWLDTWAQAYRHPEVASGRLELEQRWRDLIMDIVKQGRRDGDVGKVDAARFAATFSALLDGLSIQVALKDPLVDAATACDIAMNLVDRELGLTAPTKPAKTAKPAKSRKAKKLS
jgi:AcrR family transcriptional regulator